MTTDVAILAKAPVPGFAKTRLIPRLSPGGAAALQARFIRRAVETALASDNGPVTLWCAPDADHPLFRSLDPSVRLAVQPDGDLGARMAEPFAHAAGGLVLIGTDCPCLRPADLAAAAAHLAAGADVVIAPAEDGGYGLIAANRLHPVLFAHMPWSTPGVAAMTRSRASGAGLALVKIAAVWDVDTPDDVDRLVRSGLLDPTTS